MSLITKPYTFTVGAVIVASQHNSNFDTIYSDYNGSITTANISASAAIADTQLAQITTAGKLSGAAFTSLSSVPSGAGQIPYANVFATGMIMLWSGTIASIPSGWALCNGSNGTPDLRNRFIVCADADSGGIAKSTITGSATQSGGSTSISQANLPNVSLTTPYRYADDTGNVPGNVRTVQGASQGNVSISLGGSGTAYTQPYYALAFIMKT